MSRLVVLDYAVGRRVDIRGVKFQVAALARRAGRIRLERKTENDVVEALVLTNDQLATLLVQGDAELVDELDEPAPEGERPRPVNNIAQLDLHRIIDWVVKVFLLRYMSTHMGAGPGSAAFKSAFGEACDLLRRWFDAVGIDGVPLQTAWTTYQDLLKWRRARYSLAPLQIKGMEYRPWTQRGPHYELAREKAKEVVYGNPAFSAARVHEAVNKELDQ